MLLYLVATVALENTGSNTISISTWRARRAAVRHERHGAVRDGRYAFLAYWGLVALMLLVLAYGLWVRGANAPLRARLRRLPQHLRGHRRGACAAPSARSALAADLLQHQRPERVRDEPQRTSAWRTSRRR